MKPVNFNIHGLNLTSKAEAWIAFVLLVFLIFTYKKISQYLRNYKYRELFEAFGKKTKNGFILDMSRKGKNTYEMTDCSPSLILSYLKLPEQKEFLEKHIAGLKISDIEERKKGIFLWKQSVFVIHGEKTIDNYIYDSSKLTLKIGDWFYGWDLARGENIIENADDGAFSALIRGSSGSGKSNFANVVIDSWIQSCVRAGEDFLVIANDPKASYQWLKEKYKNVIFANAATPKGASEFREITQSLYSRIIGLSETLIENKIHVEHIKYLTDEQCKNIGIIKPIRILIICDEYERYWSADRHAPKITKDSPDELKERYELYQNQQIAGANIDNLLGIGRAYGVSFLFLTQSALISSVDFPAETNIQIFASSRISSSASSRLYNDPIIATSENCKPGEFILKTSRNGIRKVQIPWFKREKK
jgi:hypothetical protein